MLFLCFERAEALFSDTDNAKSNLRQTLQQAKNKMLELGELTSAEADDVADHIHDYHTRMCATSSNRNTILPIT